MDVDDFEIATISIVRRLRRRRSPTSERSAWASVVSDFAVRGSCDLKLLEALEEEIGVHLQALRVAALRAAWTASDLGVGDPDDVDLMPTSELRRLLAPELLARITEVAVAEAADHDPRSRPNQPQQRTGRRRARR